MRILCLDVGSSSLKFAVYDISAAAERLIADESIVDWREVKTALDGAFKTLGQVGVNRVDAVGHRIVFGGLKYAAPQLVDAAALKNLRDLIPFDRVHLPGQLEAIEHVERRFAGIPQIACFDSAFHAGMPDVAKRYPLPRSLDPPVRRYGFHGLSYEYITATLPEARRGNVVAAHLGNGASLCALRDGEPVDTTMGFSPLGGLMMGTRPGDIDPGIFLYLLECGWKHDRISDLFNKQAGLLAVSESDSDMRTLLERAPSDKQAAQAVELFIYQVRKHLGSLIAVLGGLETLIFTGGIGEKAAAIRWGTCAPFAHLGLELDRTQNQENAEIISANASRILVRTIHTNENLMIARHACALLESRSGSGNG